MEYVNKIFKKENLGLVEVVRYDGITANCHVYTFLGYDFVERDNDTVRSVLNEGVEYTELKVIEKVGSLEYHNFDEFNPGDVVVKPSAIDLLSHSRFIGSGECVSLSQIKATINSQPALHFLKYKNKKDKSGKGKVKELI